MSTNVANLIGGPATISFGGAVLYFKDAIQLLETIQTFEIATDRFGKIDERELASTVEISGTPIGVWGNLDVLFPYGNARIGDLITPVRTFGTVTSGSDSVLITDHRLRDGMAVMLSTSAADLPAPLDAATLYYIHAIDDDNISFHLTRAAAIAGTGAVDITDAGTGVHKLIMQEPLVIHALSGFRRTYHNAAVIRMPQIIASATKTMLGEIGFRAFRKNDTDATTANSLFTDDEAAFADDTSFDPQDILTVCHAAEWGNAPWDDFDTKEGWVIDATVELEDVETDCDGPLTARLGAVAVSAKAIPLGISEAQLSAAKTLQGSGAGRGRSLSGADLDISGDGTFIRLYGAALIGGPQQFGAKVDRAGAQEWRATRTFTSGLSNPLFFVGTTAPA